jgi:transcriptional regulator with XRE-family HTH domain
MKGKEFKRYRIKLRMTQRDLGERFGVSTNRIARWERDESALDAPENGTRGNAP